MAKIIIVVVLLLAVLGTAHWIEMTVRPPTGRTGVRVSGEAPQ